MQMASEWDHFRRRSTGAFGAGAFVELAKGRLAEVVLGSTDPEVDQKRLPEERIIGVNGPLAVRGVRFRVELPQDYPASPAKVNVLSRHRIKPFLEERCEEMAQEFKGREMLRPFIKWMDRSIGEWRFEASYESESESENEMDEEASDYEYVEYGERDEDEEGSGEESELVDQSKDLSLSDGEGGVETKSGFELVRDTGVDLDENAAAEDHVSESQVEGNVQEEDVWTLGQQTMLENALRQFPPSLEKHKRWRYISGAVVGKSKRQCIERFEKLRKSIRFKRGITKIEEPAEIVQSTAHAMEVESVAKVAEEEPFDESIPDVWTAAEQEALDLALARYPGSMDKNERWKAIAKCVPTKTKRECVERFKLLRSQFLRGKATAALDAVQNDDKEGEQSTTISGPQIDPTEESLPELNPEERGVKGVLTDLALHNVGWCYVDNLRVMCTCENCSKDVIVDLKMNTPFKQWCSQCSSSLQLSFHPSLAHSQAQGTIGFFDPEKLIVQDLIECSLKLGCFECSAVTPTKMIKRAVPYETDCRNCHVKLRVTYVGWISEEIGHGENHPSNKLFAKFNNNTKGKPTSAKRVRDPAIVPGNPLPNEGTCKHYRRSHRWFRFPCCGIAFPCDVCHEESGKCNETRAATLQICGFCAHEQPFSNTKPCAKCGKPIGLSKATRHWEGGKGCRNKKLMSSKDSKKFSNSVLKTRSNKAHRVGPKPT